MEEIWIQHPEFPAYNVSNKGRVYSTYKSGKVLSPKSDKDGYLEVCLVKNGHRSYKRVHRLVAECFIPNPNNLPMVNHKDENKENNLVYNLEWCDPYYNTTYSLNTEWEKVKLIPDLYLQGMTYREILEELDLDYRPDTVGEILRGRKHSSITGIKRDIRDPNRTRMMCGATSKDTALNILQDFHVNGVPQSKLTCKYNLSPASISRIVNGVRYKEVYKSFMEEHG